MLEEQSIPKIEEKILKYWKEREIFKKSLEARRGAKRFVFFEGPPTANNRPGIHHLIGRAFKDIFIRYKTMRGYFVPRRAGWDTHGLPVELEIEKQLGLKSKKEIESYGIAEFNAKAKESVWKYKDEWERFTERAGFWLDMDNPYITYDNDYIESLWWIIREIYKKDLFYKGHKVLPWCTRCGTALSSHEVAQEYHDVEDTSVYVKFKLKPGQKINKKEIPENTYVLAWTTTPWTLPGNVALAVGKNIDYILTTREINGIKESFIIAKEFYNKPGSGLVEAEFSPSDSKFYVAENMEFLGKNLIGLEYEPLFTIEKLKSDKSYKIYPADFVTTTDGTGIVHTAVMYGEDDYNLGTGLDLPAVHTVDEDGKFNELTGDLAGKYVKSSETEKQIVDHLKNRGLLFKEEKYKHSYPHCWRCKTPLLYYAKDSWFIAMSGLRKQLVKNNKKVKWMPEHLRDGRFGEFIKEAKDWAFSRERYWGTPLPIWVCEQCEYKKVVGSLAELEESRMKPPNMYYIMRHGISTKNAHDGKDGFIASKLELDKYDLAPQGVELVESRAESLKQSGEVDLIYASPFLRTKRTAEIVGKKIGIEPIIDNRLRELLHGGQCEGELASACPLEEGGRTLENKNHDDGESWNDVRLRMADFVKEIDSQNEDKKILIVSHGDPLWLLETILKNTPINNQNAFALREANYIKEGELRQAELKNHPRNSYGEVDMHKPFVDNVFLKCDKCNGRMIRIKEVADVWFDSGAMPYAQWHYPFNEGKDFDANFPADFITEGIDQTRGWFYTLLAVSTLLGKGLAYKNVVSYAHVLDEQGRKMSKSLGNTINPWEIMDQYGADAARWYFYTVNDPGDYKNFSLRTSLNPAKSFATTLLNSVRFFELYQKPAGSHQKIKPVSQNILDDWILSRLHNILIQATAFLDKYNPTPAGRLIEAFVIEDLSNWWIRRSREFLQRPKDKRSFNKAVGLLQYLLTETSKMLAPFTPFMAEHIYKKVSSEKESVHLEEWPKIKKRLVNLELEKAMVEARAVVTAGLAERKNKSIKVRQPLSSIALKKTERFDAGIEELIKSELNIKNIIYSPSIDQGVILDDHISHELMLEGYAREIMRQLQDMRKEAGYKVDDKIIGYWHSDNANVISVFELFGEEISRVALLKKLEHSQDTNIAYDVEKEFDLVTGVKIWLGIRS